MCDDYQVVIHFYLCSYCVDRIYDCFTGEFLWESDEHEGAGSTLWTMPTIPSFSGIYDNSGVWLIKSRKAIDQAHFMANALFPISTNADEVRSTMYACHFLTGLSALTKVQVAG